MHNFNTVLRFELVRTFKKPSFWLSVLAIPALMGIIFAVIIFSNQTSDKQQEEFNKQPFSLVVDDQSNLVSDAFLGQLKASRVGSKAEGIKQVQDGKVDAFFYYPKEVTKDPIEVYNKNDGIMNNSKYTSVSESLIKMSATAKVGSEQLVDIITGQVKSTQTNFENGEVINPISRMVAPALFLVIFYAVIVLLGSQMLTSTTEEKENRVTEMLLTSVSSRSLIVGKIVALIILGFVQILVILLPGLLAYTVGRDALNIPDLSSFISTIEFELWPTLLGAGLLVSGFLLFTGLLVAIGAAMPTAKEANSFFGFIITVMVVPFWFFPLLMSSSPSGVVTGLSYFPLTAPFALLIRNAFNTLPLHEAIIGLVIVFISGIIAISMAIRIFRYGTLEYSKRLSLSTIFKRKEKTTS
ncbi:MAG TPA: ABC transporter permease [Candidatus Saccharimonadales bacterium]|nr:ABC transporter permease [Candidatus Saccharimonadales bacterium]